MVFEWSELVASRNLARYGVRFTEAVHVFVDPQAVEFVDERRGRLSLIGRTARGLLYTVFEETADGRIRLLHARVADHVVGQVETEFDFDARRIKRTPRPDRHRATPADLLPRNCKVTIDLELDADLVAAFRNQSLNELLRELLQRQSSSARFEEPPVPSLRARPPAQV